MKYECALGAIIALMLSLQGLTVSAAGVVSVVPRGAPVSASAGQPSATSISVDSTSSSGIGGPNNFTWTHTVVSGGPNTLLVVGLAVHTTSADATPLSVTDNGTALTPIGSTSMVSPDGTLRTEMFEGINAPTGANPLTARGPGGSSMLSCAVAFSGVDSVTPVVAAGGDNAYRAGGPPPNLIGFSAPSARSGQVFASMFSETYTPQTAGVGPGQIPYCHLGIPSAPGLVSYADTHVIDASSTSEMWQGDANQQPVLAGVVINPQSSPTAATVTRASVVRRADTTRITWWAPHAATVAGFDVYAGVHRLTARSLPVHPAARYRVTVRHRVVGPLRLRIRERNGSVQSIRLP